MNAYAVHEALTSGRYQNVYIIAGIDELDEFWKKQDDYVPVNSEKNSKEYVYCKTMISSLKIKEPPVLEHNDGKINFVSGKLVYMILRDYGFRTIPIIWKDQLDMFLKH